MAFANKQLSQINRGCSNIEEDFSNGVNLVVMMSLAEGYYVPMYSFSMEPTAYDHKVNSDFCFAEITLIFIYFTDL